MIILFRSPLRSADSTDKGFASQGFCRYFSRLRSTRGTCEQPQRPQVAMRADFAHAKQLGCSAVHTAPAAQPMILSHGPAVEERAGPPHVELDRWQCLEE